VEKAIEEFLKTAKDWEKLPIESLEGVYVVKMPATKTRPALLSVEVNPVKDGKPLKKKGLFLTSFDMLVEFSDILTNDSLSTLMKSIDSVNAKQKPVEKVRKALKL